EAWSVSRYTGLAAAAGRLHRDYQCGEAGRQVHDFLWSELADWYIEMSKVRVRSADEAAAEATRHTLAYVLEGTLRLLHPIMPFVTEEIWQHLTSGHGRGPSGEPTRSVMVSAFPEPDERWDHPQAEADVELLLAL